MPSIMEPVVKCGYCGIEKQAANHWYIVTHEDGSITFVTWKKAAESGLLFSPNIKGYAICGQGDAHKELDAFFESIMKPVIKISE